MTVIHAIYLTVFSLLQILVDAGECLAVGGDLHSRILRAPITQALKILCLPQAEVFISTSSMAAARRVQDLLDKVNLNFQNCI
jgi:hypothetical protein